MDNQHYKQPVERKREEIEVEWAKQVSEKSNIKLHIILFVLTIFTTYFIGLGNGLFGALWYSGGIITILLSHEMGHYIMARKHGVPVTLPYFIPVPFPPFGTMGAVIKMKGRIPNRRALFDVGVAGPLGGMIIIIPVILIGVKYSQIVDASSLGESAITLGDSLMFQILANISIGPLKEGQDIVLHPLAFAGWVGLLVTAINLLPIGQLDGGHIMYALFCKRSKFITNIFLGLFIFICLFYYFGWFLLIIVLVLIKKHPPTLDDDYELDPRRKIIGILVLCLFIMAFTPVPFGFVDGLIPTLMRELRP
jgi:membrane-associated protease RseP (regulator of RpoE activity)